MLGIHKTKQAIQHMIDFGDKNTQDTLLLAFCLRAQMVTLSIRNQACKDRIDKTTLKEVNAFIKKTRVEQNRGRQLHRA
ncbi:MAG: hypothetical protein C3F07_17310 [Anaerolineales bacterium]|nr:hypothetical protein [Anaerolineae bacterium]PWB70332.1 MAG: hypothetical protein C3F07_17310 [Anaerolineales bacterium]